MRTYLKQLLFFLLFCALSSPTQLAIANTYTPSGFNKLVEAVQTYQYDKNKKSRRRGWWWRDDDDHYGGSDDDDDYGWGNDDDDDDDDSNEIPLDGGLSFLAAAGAGLSIKKIRDNMAKKHNK